MPRRPSRRRRARTRWNGAGPLNFLEHEKLFTEKAGVYKAGPYPVWTLHALGGYYGNATVIEGKDGLIVYDTGVCLEHGKLIAEEIRKISKKPIKAIVYSHHHGDHYSGTAALVSPADVKAGKVKIYAWENFEKEKTGEFDVIANRQVMGLIYYSGAALPPEDRHFHGCCGLKFAGSSGYLPPTGTFSKDTDLKISGVRVRVFYTGGEAISEFALHVPDFDMVVAADEFFYSLANLHSIRGSRPRLPENYLKALDRVRALNPEWLLGSHLMPIQGKGQIQRYVPVSRDAPSSTSGIKASGTSTRAIPRASCSRGFRACPSTSRCRPTQPKCTAPRTRPCPSSTRGG